jgi:two-component system chemotaxis response regulator CheB
MDIEMPLMNGLEAIRLIMDEMPRPVLVVTGLEAEAWVQASFQAMEDGALVVMRKPSGLPEQDPEALQLITNVKTMAGVKVVRRSLWLAKKKPDLQRKRPLTGSLAPAGASGDTQIQRKAVQPHLLDETRSPAVYPPMQVVAIGVSTGGPPALQAILMGLPPTFPAPVVIVQHISSGFVAGLARWLGDMTPLSVKVAEQGELLQPGTAYLAPDDFHLHLKPSGLVWLDPSPPIGSHRPSVTELFCSVAKSYGRQAVGVLLTGMGRDGAGGLKAMRQAGAYTIAQDEATSVIYGMPKAAIELDAVEEVLPLEHIAPRLIQLTEPIWKNGSF